jgi:hypothetical protein
MLGRLLIDLFVQRSLTLFGPSKKRFPDGLIKGFKGRICARGDQQEEVDFFETCAPVVQWTTICLMLILEVLLGLKSKQGDVTAAFLHELL